MKNVDPHAVMTSGIRTEIRHSLRSWRLRLTWQRLLNTLAVIAVLALIGHWLATSPGTILQQAVALGLVSFAQLWLSPAWRRSNPENFVAHLNRRFPEFEESAQLLLAGTDGLTTLQQLQRERVLAVYRQNLAQVERWQASVKYRPALAVFTICLLLGLFSPGLLSLANRSLAGKPMTATGQPAAVKITGIAVRVEPPAYTGLAATTTDRLDLTLPEGSLVDWRLAIEPDGGDYALQLTGGEQILLTPDDDNYLRANAVIDNTDLYRIVDTREGNAQDLDGFHALTVKLDRPPDIRLVEPVVTVLEIPKNGPANFNSQALVRDDYGLQNVEILASVAKGSGEGVKFRDQKLQFDQSGDTAKGQLYQRQWDLEALGMEPGDEVYFTVIATDNRKPMANTGRSETIVVRWLEDQPAVAAADGLGIDFIPEYFKSQRQIIIDTEQLIADQPQLALQTFKNTSFGIGHAQADLKEKYGQYLGDEFGEGPGEQLSGAHEDAAIPADADAWHADAHGSGDTNKNINSTADILRVYGHNHGDPEIGPITQRNPVALMKRAVSEMWQAERHLMQAEPGLALPFEYEAYKYLKLARQADRIYVKRLGFEPPPVSEDRRLSGKRDEIISYRLSAPTAVEDTQENRSEQALLKHVYQLLKEYSSDTEFNDEEREMLTSLGRVFTRWSQQEAGLIQYAASLEKLSLGGRLQLPSCETCLQDLEAAIWNRISESDARLRYRNAVWNADESLIRSYQQLLHQNTASNPSGGR